MPVELGLIEMVVEGDEILEGALSVCGPKIREDDPKNGIEYRLCAGDHTPCTNQRCIFKLL
jgi:hypothetical protein